MNKNEEIENLKKKIAFIEKKQIEFGSYIEKLKQEVSKIEGQEITSPLENLIEKETTLQNTVKNSKPSIVRPKQVKKKSFIDQFIEKYELRFNLENFIGTNLISKIGILILTIGVIIGAKLAIDKELISPLARIIIGYGISASVLAFAIKLKAKYLNFSAVLLSGALCMLYFLSYISYDFYGFVPASISFGLMLLFTVFTVFAALNYNKQIIALLGLVGSYAIPFLLSNDSGNVLFLFSYLTLINLALLYISFLKNWKPVFYVALIFTWLIFSSWLFLQAEESELMFALVFSTIFYLIFYTTFISYKLIKKQVFKKFDIVFILFNSFIFYACGYYTLSSDSYTTDYLGIFTIANALVHFIVAKLFLTKKNSDINLFYLAIGLVFIFITIAIPVQLKGEWIIIFWALEAALLFSLGRIKKVAFYEKLSYPLILISAFSLLSKLNLGTYYNDINPFFNLLFISAIIGTLAFAVINYIHFTKPISHRVKFKSIYRALNFVFPVLFIMILFNTFSNEISLFFNQKIFSSQLEILNENGYKDYYSNYQLYNYKDLSILLFAGFLVLFFSFLNLKFVKNVITNRIVFIAKTIMLFIALSGGLLICSDIRFTYLQGSEYFNYSSIALYIRYVIIALIAVITYFIHYYVSNDLSPFSAFKKYLNIFIHLVILWLLSSELLHWLDVFGNKNAYKLALSILWGSYSLLMVVIGLWKNQKYTRIAAIGLFAVTLIKLFFYDISNLSMIYRTIVFIVLGVLLLIISFLYNKFATTKIDSNE